MVWILPHQSLIRKRPPPTHTCLFRLVSDLENSVVESICCTIGTGVWNPSTHITRWVSVPFPYFVLYYHAKIKHHDPKQLAEGKVYLAYMS